KMPSESKSGRFLLAAHASAEKQRVFIQKLPPNTASVRTVERESSTPWPALHEDPEVLHEDPEVLHEDPEVLHEDSEVKLSCTELGDDTVRKDLIDYPLPLNIGNVSPMPIAFGIIDDAQRKNPSS
ncbi:hypothetical protein STEG23_008335, partial [Scotinomys teguina]